MASICAAKPSPASFLAASTTLPNSINPASLMAEQQGGFNFEVPVRGRPRNTQPLADLGAR